jgi:hypothetical protein
MWLGESISPTPPTRAGTSAGPVPLHCQKDNREMKLPLLTLAALTCSFATVASAQKSNPISQKQAPGVVAPPHKTPVTPAAPKGVNSSGSNTSNLVGPNDTCTSATAISGPGPFFFDTVGATTDGPSNCGAFTDDVWFDWTAPSSGPFTVSLCGGGAAYDSEVAVYNTAACLGPNLACNDDFCGLVSQTVFTAVGGNVYKIQVGGFAYNQGTGTFTIMAPPPPSPDDCTAAQVIAGPGPFAFSDIGSTTGTQGQSESACNFYGLTGIDSDVWFTWTAPASGSATLSLCSGTGGMDSKVAIYNGAGCPTSAAIACNDDSCGLTSQVVWCSTNAQSYTIQLGTFPGATQGSGSFTIVVSPSGGGNDECTGATALSGPGPYPFDNSAATTGCAGQGNTICAFYGLPAIDHDVWFTWIATASGNATLTDCGQTPGMDSKVAIYTGAGCPTSQAIACNDDACGSFESSVCFPVTNGQAYTIQLGTFPGASGAAGTFTLAVAPAAPPCQYDDGSTENLLGWTAGGEMVWLQRFGAATGTTAVSAIQVAWGSALYPGYNPPNGTPAKVAIWDDPNDDGDPSDGVLLQVVNTTVQNEDTDTYNTIPITPVNVNGVFFIGAGLSHVAGQYVAPMDTDSCSPSGVAWFFGNNNPNPVDYANILNNAQPPYTFDSIGFPCVVMLRGGCNLSPMSTFCLPGQSGVIACPCSNPPAGGGLGCNNYGAGPAASCTMTAAGTASLAADTLVFTSTGENNTSLTIFLQGTTSSPTGVPYGAGVRCVTGILKRLYTGGASAGTITRPGGGDPSVHVRSAALGNPILAGETRYYMTYYRDPLAAGPCGNTASTFNDSQAGSVLWAP